MLDLNLPFAVSTFGAPDAPPLVVLPGGPCRDPEYLEDLAGIGESAHVIVLHPRGTSRTGGLSRGWWTDADDVVALLDALHVPSASVLAHSAGTRLALATATRYPGRVASLALITPPATWLCGSPSDAATIGAARTEPEVVSALAAFNEDTATTDAGFVEQFQRQAPASYAKWTERERDHARVGRVSLAAASAWFGDIPGDAAKRIRSASLPPTTVIAGDADLLTGVQPVADYAAAIGAELVWLAACGHYPWVEQPAAFRDAVTTWLRRG